MSGDVIDVDEALLESWPLPQPGGSKRSRGDVIVIGGARSAPGAAQLAGLSALRVGAGRLTLAVGSGVAAAVGVAVPESGVFALEETPDGHVRGRSVSAFSPELADADAVLVGPGLDDLREARRMLVAVAKILPARSTVVLDAYALGALGALGASRASGTRSRRLPRFERAILTPNESEAAALLGHPIAELVDDTAAMAERYTAVVSCMGVIADASGAVYRVGQAGPGLGTSGSGDVLAGAIAGLAARGCDPLPATVWGTYLHAKAGEWLASEVAPVGFLASDISERLPHELADARGA